MKCKFQKSENRGELFVYSKINFVQFISFSDLCIHLYIAVVRKGEWVFRGILKGRQKNKNWLMKTILMKDMNIFSIFTYLTKL